MNATLNGYFFRRFVSSVFSTLVAIFALVYLIDMIEVGRRGQFADLSFSVAALLSALRVPSFVEQAFPFIILFSSIFTLLSLNRRLELVVARAAGVSVWQIVAPFVAASALIGVFAVCVYNPLAAAALAKGAELETRITSGGHVESSSDRIPWLRQSADGVESILGARAISKGGLELAGVTAYVIGDNGTVRERIDAPQADLIEHSWVMENAVVTRIGFSPDPPKTIELPTTLKPEYVEERLANPDSIPLWQLHSKIQAARSLGYNADAFAMQYNTLLARPALFVAMTLLAATVSVKFARTGQSGRTIIGGITAGFVLYVVTFLAQALGSNAIIPPVIAAWFPAVAAGLFGVTALLYQEDG
ncbi:LPS export ABC transporter permease LptG [Aurantimonas sp. MSK8Z-1]|uniref:LPS export ABC transporter permease LptG n=1 Tax=Mangrovibrevibacter kandeliae TaxID=2968473 RepID=UPI002117A559|nr:LPS export ABC transporter permease LptG [Aurantimonas sp. MSK8Z-1]MCW4114164.1 LPS export ABC transporter permease LptG [Aurantimonas sp. MSK8Z-1]